MSNAHMIDPSYQAYTQALSEGFPMPTYSGPTHVAPAPAPAVASPAVYVPSVTAPAAPAAPECNFAYHGGVHYWNPS